MRGRYLYLLALLFCCISCLKEDKKSTSPQAAITSFTLGSFHVRVPGITQDGRDTVSYIKESGTLYPMTIDQVNNQIFNVDSLSYGSVISRVTTSLTGTGTITFRYADEPENNYLWTNYDSIDFSRKVLFSVISTDGSYTRTYNVRINICKVFPDSLLWQGPDTTGFPVLKGIGAVVRNDSVFCFGTDTMGVMAMSCRNISNGNWNGTNGLSGLPAGWNSRVTVCGGKFYTVAGGAIYGSSDGLNWSSVKTGIKSIVVSGNDNGELWAVRQDSMIFNMNDTTQKQRVPENFPDSAAVMFSYPLATNKNLSRSLLVGISKDTAYASIWAMLTGDKVWTKVDTPSNSELRLPVVQSLSVIRYDDAFFCTGKGMGGFRQSNDNGVTWGLCKRVVGNYSSLNQFMQLPVEMNNHKSGFTCVTDGNGYIWIMTDDGRAWHGAINRLKNKKK